MKYFSLLLLTISISSFAQENIIGNTSKAEILKTEHNSWFNRIYDTYEPSQEIAEKLKHLFSKNEFHVDVYFGTWCEDSQREVPKLIKLLEHGQFNFENLNLVGVNRDKIVPDISDTKRKELNVFNVPTIIISENGREINRFVEYAQESLEEDMLKIFSNESYKHSYQN